MTTMATHTTRKPTARSGSTIASMLVALCLLFLCTAAWRWLFHATPEDPYGAFETTFVTRGNMRKMLSLDAEVHSADPVIVENTCYWWPIEILEILPEGSIVKKGDIVCRLDASDPEELKLQRQLKLIRAKADLASARATEVLQTVRNERRMSTAELDALVSAGLLDAYQGAEFHQSLEKAERETDIAEEDVYTATEEFRYVRQLATDGVRSWSNLERVAHSVSRAERQFELKKLKKNILEKYEHPRSTASLTMGAKLARGNVFRTELQNSLATTVARIATLKYEKIVDVLQEEFDRVSNTIAASIVRAPCNGELIHSNRWESRSGGNPEIQVGKHVHYRQEIFGLVDRRKVVLKGRISDRLAYMVRPHQKVEFQIGARGEVYAGWVSWISPMSSTQGKFSFNRSNWVEVRLDPDVPTEKLGPLMNIKCSILVEERQDAIQIPVDAIVEFENKMTAIVKSGHRIRRITFEPGVITESRVEVVAGLSEGEQVIVAPPETLRELASEAD
jgi:HlyD family secretion protein